MLESLSAVVQKDTKRLGGRNDRFKSRGSQSKQSFRWPQLASFPIITRGKQGLGEENPSLCGVSPWPGDVEGTGTPAESESPMNIIIMSSVGTG